LRTETDVIERIWNKLPTGKPKGTRAWLREGVGDDAAVIAGRPQSGMGTRDWVLSCDAFLEGSHFLANVHPPDAVGYKALTRATSDLAAMGAVPRFFMLSLALPASRTGKWLDGFLSGMARAAQRLGMVLIGGDTSRNCTIVMNLTVGGVVARGHALTRAGARVGEGIYVTGRLGAAQLGLDLVLRGLHRNRSWKRLLAPHLFPNIHVELGHWLASGNRRMRLATAAIDTSDGLSTELNHICRASGVGARVWAEEIPVVTVPESLRKKGFDPLELALHGGEDYQLLFTAAGRMPDSYRGVQITRIGEIVSPKNGRNARISANQESLVELIDACGVASLLTPRGWDHFRKEP
jgi:thiamine-monophosphate kinase